MEKRTYVVGGNWKSNGSVKFVRDIINEMLNKMKYDKSKVEVVVAPMIIHLAPAKAMITGNVQVCAQNVSAFMNGAYTGEVSAEQIKDFGINWAIIGHSERRVIFEETIDLVAKKIQRSQEQGLNAIVCVGEQNEQRLSGTTFKVLEEQLEGAKRSIKDWSKIVIAYEPVWAVGTGQTATPAQAQEAHEMIRNWIATNVNEETANKTRIIYGGSVNETNADELIAQSDIDGFLVGGASLNTAFASIVDTCNKAQ